MPKCQEQLVDIAKMQADDYHLDRPLFYACEKAVRTFCPETKSGDGRIYKCLLENKNNDLMPKKVGFLFCPISLNMQVARVCMGGITLMKYKNVIILLGNSTNVSRTCIYRKNS